LRTDPRRPKNDGMSALSENVPSEALLASLTDSVRRLVDVTIRSQASAGAIASAKAKIDAAADELSHDLLPGSFGVQENHSGRPLAWGNAVIGLRNALAPPLVVHHETNGSVWADVTLGAAYEGPPGHVHGGICALLLDHILGATAHKPGQPAVTGTLRLRYERGTRLGPLRAEARVDRVEGVKTYAVGQLSTADGVTVRAEGVFIHPRSPGVVVASHATGPHSG
jgi:acyl-coenzyme A thioesterase PaaI-like protein